MAEPNDRTRLKLRRWNILNRIEACLNAAASNDSVPYGLPTNAINYRSRKDPPTIIRDISAANW